MCFYFVQVGEEIVDSGFVGALRLGEPTFAAIRSQNAATKLDRGRNQDLLYAIVNVIIHPLIGKINLRTEVHRVQIYLAIFLR